jgi:hypothetical protein
MENAVAGFTSSSIIQTTSTTTSPGITTSSSGKTGQTTSTSDTTSAAEQTNSPSGKSSTKTLSTGDKAGIGVGVAVGVVLLGTAAFFLGRRYSNNRNQSTSQITSTNIAPPIPPNKPTIIHPVGWSGSEMPTTSNVAEMPSHMPSHIPPKTVMKMAELP